MERYGERERSGLTDEDSVRKAFAKRRRSFYTVDRVCLFTRCLLLCDSFFFLPYWYTDPSKERKVGRESPRCGVEVFRTCVAILYYCFGPVLFFLVARTRMAREVAG